MFKQIKQFFNRRIKRSDGDKLSVTSRAENNPYLQSKALWNDMYGDVQTKLENSYRIILIHRPLL